MQVWKEKREEKRNKKWKETRKEKAIKSLSRFSNVPQFSSIWMNCNLIQIFVLQNTS